MKGIYWLIRKSPKMVRLQAQIDQVSLSVLLYLAPLHVVTLLLFWLPPGLHSDCQQQPGLRIPEKKKLELQRKSEERMGEKVPAFCHLPPIQFPTISPLGKT